MDQTALTVGGFTQPGVARTIIEQHTGAQRGFSQCFLWIFPKPTFAKCASLKPVPVPDEITDSIGKKDNNNIVLINARVHIMFTGNYFNSQTLH